MTRVLMVCLGNICRSPTAHGVFRDLVRERGLQQRIDVDSCGTSSYHNGEGADANMVRAAAEQGIDLSDLHSRLLVRSDFHDFDLIVVMDGSNERNTEALRPAGNDTPVVRFMDFVPDAPSRDVPDPYYGGMDGFRNVVNLIRAGCGPLLDHALTL
ncbi:MAG: low molecular weight phosphotyrosine protein phosphatase [Proteobacteria bacterium]|nr:low molecular weight phosphotyrosine protein phosphatase [Pseudomonadota bacterium]